MNGESGSSVLMVGDDPEWFLKYLTLTLLLFSCHWVYKVTKADIYVVFRNLYLEFLGIFIHSGFINPALCCVPQMWQLSSLWWRVAATTWWSEKIIRLTDYRKPSIFSRTFGTTGQRQIFLWTHFFRFCFCLFLFEGEETKGSHKSQEMLLKKTIKTKCCDTL